MTSETQLETIKAKHAVIPKIGKPQPTLPQNKPFLQTQRRWENAA